MNDTSGNGSGNKPDSDKSIEELQREILLKQKELLERQEHERKNPRKPLTTWHIIVAILVSALVIAVIAWAVNDYKTKQENTDRVNEQIRDYFENPLGSELFLNTLPMHE